MKHIKNILQEVPAVALMNQNSKVGKTSVNPMKCKAELKPCYPTEFFGCVEECKACNRKF